MKRVLNKVVGLFVVVLLLVPLVCVLMATTPKHIGDRVKLICIRDALLSPEAKIENGAKDLSSVHAINQGLGTPIFKVNGPSSDKKVTLTFNPTFTRIQSDWVAVARRNDWRNLVYGPLILWGDGRIERNRESPDSQADPNSVQTYFYIEGKQ